MERDKLLSVLSNGHQDMLRLARRLQSAGDSEISGLQEEIRICWEHQAREHLRMEEEVLLPLLAESVDLHRIDAVADILVDHAVMRSLIKAFLTADTPCKTTMDKLGTILETHIYKEERLIYPLIERSLTGENRSRLTKILNHS